RNAGDVAAERALRVRDDRVDGERDDPGLSLPEHLERDRAPATRRRLVERQMALEAEAAVGGRDRPARDLLGRAVELEHGGEEHVLEPGTQLGLDELEVVVVEVRLEVERMPPRQRAA